MLLEDLSLKRFKFSPFVFKILSNNINKGWFSKINKPA